MRHVYFFESIQDKLHSWHHFFLHCMKFQEQKDLFQSCHSKNCCMKKTPTKRLKANIIFSYYFLPARISKTNKKPVHESHVKIKIQRIFSCECKTVPTYKIRSNASSYNLSVVSFPHNSIPISAKNI